MTRWQVADSPGSSGVDRVSVDLREAYAVDEDGTFETPDDLDGAKRRRLEEAGHEILEEETGELDDAEKTPEPVDEAEADGDDGDEQIDDEYAELDRSELYELYKDRGGPKGWNDVDAEELRYDLRVHDDQGSFPTLEEADD